MKKLYKQVEGYFKRFPEGIDPYQMVTRLLEECGEIAKEINHFEDSGIKNKKYGEPDKTQLANEIRQTIIAVLQIVVYYDVINELEKSIDDMIEKQTSEGLFD